MDEDKLHKILEIGGRVELYEAYLRGANLRRANLMGAYLVGADMRGADLAMADLRITTMRGADLSMADLTGADLTGANLRDADLSMADLTRADLSDARLLRANLTGAILPTGETWEAYLSETVPQLLLAGERGLEAISAWGKHSWEDCPIHVAFSIRDPREAPLLLRSRIKQFVQLYDAGLIPIPTDETLRSLSR